MPPQSEPLGAGVHATPWPQTWPFPNPWIPLEAILCLGLIGLPQTCVGGEQSGGGVWPTAVADPRQNNLIPMSLAAILSRVKWWGGNRATPVVGEQMMSGPSQLSPLPSALWDLETFPGLFPLHCPLPLTASQALCCCPSDGAHAIPVCGGYLLMMWKEAFWLTYCIWCGNIALWGGCGPPIVWVGQENPIFSGVYFFPCLLTQCDRAGENSALGWASVGIQAGGSNNLTCVLPI